ncbi:MAG: glycosyltransferase family 39 protein [Candidatus Aminicenantaceae bacterium]
MTEIQGKEPVSRALLLILLLSLMMNGVGIWWGLPGSGWAPDEVAPSRVIAGLEQGLSQGWYVKYPPLHFYLLTLAYLPILALHWLTGLDLHGYQVNTVLFFMGRSLSLLMGTSIVYIVYRCGREIFDRRAALFTALISALTVPFVYYSKTANLEIPFIFWFMLSLWFYLRVLKAHRLADYLLFTAAAIFSVCTKDQAYGFYVLMPLGIILSAHLSRRKEDDRAGILASVFNRKTILSLALAAVLFVLIQNILFSPDGFMGHVRFITGPGSQRFQVYENTLSGHAGMLWSSLRYIRFSFGWPMFLLCALGLAAFFRARKEAPLLFWLLLPGLSYYIFFISVIRYNCVRFFLPLCLTLAFFGGRLLAGLLAPGQRLPGLRIAAVVLLFLYTGLYASSGNIQMVLDARYKVERSLERNIAPDALIGLVGSRMYLPRLESFEITRRMKILTRRTLQRLKPDYLLVNSDFARINSEKVYDRLRQEKLGYRLVLRYRFDSPWLLWSYRDIFRNDQKWIFTNLDKINPEVEIYERID